MKKTNSNKSISEYLEHRNTFHILRILLEKDLLNPKVESAAIETLNKLQQLGYVFDNFYLEDEGCIPCLHLSMMSASELYEDLLFEEEPRGRVRH